MNILSRIKSSDIKLGNSFVIGKQEAKTEKIDITDQNFLNSLSAEMQAGIAKIIDNAKAQASEILTQAQSEAEMIKQSAFEEGNQKGYKEGFEKGSQDGFNKVNEELSLKAHYFEEFINLVIKAKNSIYKEAQSELLEFVVAIAEKLVCDKLKEDKNLILRVIEAATAELKEKENIKITVHPSMAQNIYSITDDLMNHIMSIKTVKILEDKMLKEDGLIIETEESRIDSGFSTRVGLILQELKKEAQSTRIIPDDVETESR